EVLCTWGRIDIHRFGPGSDLTQEPEWTGIMYLNGSEGTLVDDSPDLLPNVEYLYVAQLSIWYIDSDPDFEGDYQPDVLCSRSNVLTATVTTPDYPSMISNFDSINLSDDNMYFSWSNPTGTPATAIYLEKFIGGGIGWQLLTPQPLSAGTSEYSYEYDESERGMKLHTRIKVLGPTGFSDPVYNINYMGHRNMGEPLVMHGAAFTKNMWLGMENPIIGLPELVVVVATGIDPSLDQDPYLVQPGRNILLSQSCFLDYDNPEDVVPDDGINWNPGDYDWFAQNVYGYYMSEDGGILHGVNVVDSWNTDFYNSAMTINLIETDNAEFYIDSETQVETSNLSIAAKLPLKLFGIGGSLNWSSSRTTVKQIPHGDINLGKRTIYYWDKLDNGLTFANGLRAYFSNNNTHQYYSNCSYLWGEFGENNQGFHDWY
ncbi:MAG: hypothetical protein AB3N16_10715, partial [Flavobacteriaceae bacterium]